MTIYLMTMSQDCLLRMRRLALPGTIRTGFEMYYPDGKQFPAQLKDIAEEIKVRLTMHPSLIQDS